MTKNMLKNGGKKVLSRGAYAPAKTGSKTAKNGDFGLKISNIMHNFTSESEVIASQSEVITSESEAIASQSEVSYFGKRSNRFGKRSKFPPIFGTFFSSLYIRLYKCPLYYVKDKDNNNRTVFFSGKSTAGLWQRQTTANQGDQARKIG